MNNPVIQNMTKEFDPRLKFFLEFCKLWHGDQKRKYINEPYWHHLVRVANNLQMGDNTPHWYKYVALGHDLLEDTEVLIGQVGDALSSIENYKEPTTLYLSGRAICNMTSVYTSEAYSSLSRAKRKAMELDRMVEVFGRVEQTVKYCDILDNTVGIVPQDPEFAAVYLREKEAVVSRLDKGDPCLRERAYQQIQMQLSLL